MSTNTTADDDAVEWFATAADRMGISQDDLIHPADVDHEDAEWLIGATVLQFTDTLDERNRTDFSVSEIADLPTAGDGEMTFAVYAYKQPGDRKVGMNIEIDDRDRLNDWGRQVRFVKPDAINGTQSPEAAIERLREMPSGADLSESVAYDLADAFGGEMSEDSFYEGHIGIDTFLRRMVGQVTDESPRSARDYFGRSITGHKKTARGVYKANLTILEDYFGMETTYSREE